MEVDVSQEKPHGAALGDFPGFVQIFLRALGAGVRAGEAPQPGAGEAPQPGAGEEAPGKVILMAGAAEAGHGGVNVGEVRGQKSEVRMLENRRVERGAAKREVVKGDVKKRVSRKAGSS